MAGRRRRARASRTAASRSPGRPTRKMTINALNSGAKVWLADLEDATSPTWANVIERPARRCSTRSAASSSFTSPEGKALRGHRRRETPDDRDAAARLAPGREAPAVHRPRRPVASRHPARSSTSGCTSSTTPHALIANGRGPYFYLPKLESHRRGAAVGRRLRLQRRRTSGSRTARSARPCSSRRIPAAFEMEEILYELRDHCAGLNAGRWDYIFSIIKNFRGARRALRAARPQRRSR